MIWGGTISGNCAIGRRRMETSPPRTVTIAITMATIGRRTKNAAISVACRRWGGVSRDVRPRLHGLPCAQLRRAKPDLGAGFEAGRDDPPRPDTISERHRPHADLAVVTDDAQL